MTDLTADTRRVVGAYFAAVGRGDKAAALDLVAERVDWGGAGDASVPWIGQRDTRSEVGEFLDLLAANLETERLDITDMVVEGPDAVVVVSLRQRVVRTGAPFEGEIALLLKVEEGRVVRYRYFEDSLALARAYGAI